MSRSSRRTRTRGIITPSYRYRLPVRSTSSLPITTLGTFRTFQRLATPSVSRLRVYEDRRLWHPDGLARPARSFDRATTLKMGPAKPSRPWQLPSAVNFTAPSRVVLCVRRKIRKQVMFAKHKAGRGGQRPPRWSYWSSVNC